MHVCFDIWRIARYNFNETGKDASITIADCLSRRVLIHAQTGFSFF